MSFESLSGEVLNESRDEANRIFSKADKEVQDINTLNEEELTKVKTDLLDKFEKDLAQLESETLGSYIRDAKREILEAKFSVYEEFREKVQERISSLQTSDKEKIFKSLIKLANSQMESTHVYVSEDDLKLVKKLIPSSIKIFSRQSLSGLVFENVKNREELDLSFDSLIEIIFQENEEEFMNEVFK
jgi:vacuolar-type H+-ATPase subunit E/Vma4